MQKTKGGKIMVSKKVVEDVKSIQKYSLPKKENSEIDVFIQQAIANNLPVETMEKLFALRGKVKAEQAKEAYIEALAQFQNSCPIIEKTKKVLNKDGSVRYQYAPLDTIIEKIKPYLLASQLSYTWDIENKDKLLKVTARITHVLGHSETSSFDVPIDTEGYMTAPQKYASAQTFAKRYSLCNALGISTGEEDTDATDVEVEVEAKSEKSKIIFLLRSLGKKVTKKEEIEKVVKELTTLKLEDKNYGEIVGRLEMLVKEKNEYDN